MKVRRADSANDPRDSQVFGFVFVGVRNLTPTYPNMSSVGMSHTTNRYIASRAGPDFRAASGECVALPVDAPVKMNTPQEVKR